MTNTYTQHRHEPITEDKKEPNYKICFQQQSAIHDKSLLV